MRWSAAAAAPVSHGELSWVGACLALALAVHLAVLPPWLLATVCAAIAIRLTLSGRGHAVPGRGWRGVVSAVAAALLFVEFHTFNGLAAGTALLCLMAGLKFLETQSRRDIYIITLIIYFLNLAALLQSDSFWLLGYAVAVSALATLALLRVGHDPPSALKLDARRVARILAQAVPLALVLWLFFPRLYEPLWQMQASNRGLDAGLGDTMSPGDITELALSQEIAFRVRFEQATPSPRERYWRGPVLHEFDGRTWRRTDEGAMRANALVPLGGAYRYRLSLEPHAHNWVYALDWPASWDLPHGLLTSDYTLVQPAPISEPLDVVATSYSRVRAAAPLSQATRALDTRLPPGRNPRTLELALEMHRAHPQAMSYVAAVLEMIRSQPFFYTLTPPALAEDSIDDFLFKTRRGFCGHYASAFAVLMRAAGIPTRVVTGYQGGAFNRFADYWIVRQSDAHAWDEIWVEESGWLRIDPTSAIAPERVQREVNESVAAYEPFASRWQRRTPWLADTRLRLDALHQLWRDRILRFDESAQAKLLGVLRIPNPDGEKLVAVLGAGLGLAMLWLTWQVRRELRPRPSDPLARAYAGLCRKLAAAGVPRQAYEGPEAYAARVARERPDLAAAVTALCERYARLRYGESTSARAGEEQGFIAAVRSFRARA